MDEPLTKSLERYDVLDRIAVGGMAEVFLAKAYGAHGFEKTLAIKRILPELARDPEFEARFIAEAKVAVRLSHANVVQVLDFGRIGESLFIAMEYVDGLDLAAMLRKFKDEHRPVPLPAAFHIAIEIIRALDFAHGHNVVHRDVSPSNVLVSRAGEVKIADFGIAVAAQPHHGGGTGPRRVMGKWRYMSPEQARGDTLDTRSDLFSAAAVIFELFTGEKLFPGDEAADIIKNIENMPIPKLSSLRPGLPSRLDDVIAGPLARKPIDRPMRPAVVLRSLIELSYESSIMATALDVAEALATVIPAKRAGGLGALDEVIRKQLHEQSVARRTAVTDGKPPSTDTLQRGDVSTGLFRKVDNDGLARLEEADPDPTKVAAPRTKRPTGEGPPQPDTGVHALYDAAHDKDRHTEPGGPPTGQVPKVGDSLAALRAQAGRRSGGLSRRLAWLGLAAVAIAGGGIGVWTLTRGERAEPVITPPVADAMPAEAKGTLEVDSFPSGAIVTIADTVLGSGPRSAKVTSGKRVRVRLELKGYQTFEDHYVVEAGKTFMIKQPLVVAPANLRVDTTPPGAQVTRSGQLLGITPFDLALPAATGVELVIAKQGYDPARAKVDLIAGEVTAITRELKESTRFGFVQINVAGTAKWAEVYFNGRSLGRNRSATGIQTLQLPVGRHTLTLINAPAGKRTTVAVDVVEGRTRTVAATFD